LKISGGFRRADLILLGLAITLSSISIAHGQVTIDVSKITCEQLTGGKVGSPKTTATWLNGYYHGKVGSTTIDTQQSEAIFEELMHYCRLEHNSKVPVMQALESLVKSK
jgi:acid stress chaperone HdeB